MLLIFLSFNSEKKVHETLQIKWSFLYKVNEVIAIEGMPTLVISGGALRAGVLVEEWVIQFQVLNPSTKTFRKV